MTRTVPDMTEALQQLQAATKAKKCWSCNCFHGTLKTLDRDLPIDLRRPDLVEALRAAQAVLQPVKYECLGCDPCHPPQAMNALGIAGEICEAAPVEARSGWPPLPGSYQVLRYSAPVAVCTLTDEELAQSIASAGSPHLAIIGSMQTENLGIERMIANLIANPNIRFLILCGEDTRKAVGHLPGASLLALSSSGLDAAGHIIGSPGKRPVLKNLGREAVDHFRQVVAVVDRIGCTDVQTILGEVATCAARNPGPSTPCATVRPVETITGSIPEHMVSDPSGYVVIDVDQANRQLVLEHYATTGVLDLVVRGTTANDVMTPVLERQLVSRLDHAGYLGKELARAEAAMRDGTIYTQDAAPERKHALTSEPTPESACGSGCGCHATEKPASTMVASPPALSCCSTSSTPVASSGTNRQETRMPNATKTMLILGGLVILAVVIVGLRAWQPTPATGHTTTTVVTAAPGTVLGVNEFMKATESPEGTVAINGVVSGAVPEQHLVTIIDDAEGACIDRACCAPLTLPVRWSGTVPARGSAVTVSGQVDKADGKLVFVAATLVPRVKAP